MSDADGDPARIERDLDHVDSTLAALDAGELAEAEALAAELAAGRAETSLPHPA